MAPNSSVGRHFPPRWAYCETLIAVREILSAEQPIKFCDSLNIINVYVTCL